ncbi:MAG: hypothetical protein MZV65_28510 [Chromatiales bacterium]|nr:hypothetical protein [Chromatiales bacterium]
MKAQDLIGRAAKLAGNHDAAKLAEIINAGVVPQRVKIGAVQGRWVELDGDEVIAYRRNDDGSATIVNRAAATPAMLESLLIQHAADVARIHHAPTKMGILA